MKKRIWISPTPEDSISVFRSTYTGALELMHQSLGIKIGTTEHRSGSGQSETAYVAAVTPVSQLAGSASVRDVAPSSSRMTAFREHTPTPPLHQPTLRQEAANLANTSVENSSGIEKAVETKSIYTQLPSGNSNVSPVIIAAKQFVTLPQTAADSSSPGTVIVLASTDSIVTQPGVAGTTYHVTLGVSINSNVADAVDVASFGALGDGVTDDAPAIQSAEIYAAFNDKILKFGPGKFLLKEKLYLQTNDRLFGCIGATTFQAAPGLSTLMALNGSPNGFNNSASPINNVSVSGIIFKGDLYNTQAGPLVVTYIANAITFTHDAFYNSNDIGMLLSNTANSTVDSCSFGNIGNKPLLTGSLGDAAQGIAFTDSSILKSSNNTVSHSSFSAIGLDAISASDQTAFSVTNNLMIGLNVLTGWNHYSAGAAGVYLTNDTGILATENYISGASGNGFDLDNVVNVTIASNHALMNGSGGIVLAHTTNVLISGNIANDNNQFHGYFQNQSGISITGNASQPSTAISVIGNTADDDQPSATQSWGFQVVNGAVITNLTLSGNYFGGNVVSYSNRHDLCLVGTFKTDTNLKTITGFILASNVVDASIDSGSGSLVFLSGIDAALSTDLVHPDFQISHAVSLADLQALSLSSLQSSSTAWDLSSNLIAASHLFGFLPPNT